MGCAWRAATRMVICLAGLLAACGGAAHPAALAPGSFPDGSAGWAPTRTPFQPLPPTFLIETPISPPATPDPASNFPSPSPELPGSQSPITASPTSTLASTQAPDDQLSIWVDPRLPSGLSAALAQQPGLAAVPGPEWASLRLEPGEQNPAGTWVYALAVPFPTRLEGVTFDMIQQAWSGVFVAPFVGRPLLMSENTLLVFSQLWGPPGPGAVQTLPDADLLDTAWQTRPSWAILPFDALEPRWKVLTVDGLSPLWREFDPSGYPLAVHFSLLGKDELLETAAARLPLTNRDPARLTTLAMTGVTALVRATAFAMERQGVLYPGKDVRDWLRSADLTHISNEVPFAADCPYPDPFQAGMRFCSDPRYIDLLEDVGADIIELTGDHFQDWGVAAMNLTLEMYTERGWPYYGGGANLDEGRQALLVEHNGNRLAFLGCNAKGGSFAQAGPNKPGAVTCDFVWLQVEITRLRQQGYLPVMTFQHFEYYTYQAQPNQITDSRLLAEAGAVIVSGSQAHQPQAMEFAGDGFIHYGLGNLFFDQYEISQATRQAFIDRHIFYAGRYIGVELLPITFIDYARPRPMTLEEQDELFKAVFSASGW